MESAIGLDSDEVQFLISTLWDKVKVLKQRMSLEDMALGLQGISRLDDPISENIRQYIFYQLLTTNPVDIGILPRDDTTGKLLSTPPIETENVSAKADVEVEVEEDPFNEKKVVNSVLINPKEGVTSPLLSSEDGLIIPSLVSPVDIIKVVRGLRLNRLQVPKWLALEYFDIEEKHIKDPVIPQSRTEKVIIQRYKFLHPMDVFESNTIIDGFRLDLIFPNAKLNIELDSPNHRIPARIRFDRARDAYITGKGYEVR